MGGDEGLPGQFQHVGPEFTLTATGYSTRLVTSASKSSSHRDLAAAGFEVASFHQADDGPPPLIAVDDDPGPAQVIQVGAWGKRHRSGAIESVPQPSLDCRCQRRRWKRNHFIAKEGNQPANRLRKLKIDLSPPHRLGKGKGNQLGQELRQDLPRRQSLLFALGKNILSLGVFLTTSSLISTLCRPAKPMAALVGCPSAKAMLAGGPLTSSKRSACSSSTCVWKGQDAAGSPGDGDGTMADSMLGQQFFRLLLVTASFLDRPHGRAVLPFRFRGGDPSSPCASFSCQRKAQLFPLRKILRRVNPG